MMLPAMVAGRIGSTELEDLVARAARLDLSLPVASLERLAALAPAGDAVAPGSPAGSQRLQASLSFQAGQEGFPVVHLTVGGSVPLTCQRCLQLLVMPVEIDVQLTVVATDADTARLAEPFDSVVLDQGELDVARVLEDEVLAALPLAPKHPPSVPCRPADEFAAPDTHRPLAGLAGMLGRSGPQDE